MFLTGTLLNVATVLLGASLGLLIGARMPARLRDSLTTGLGFFTVAVAVALAVPIFTDSVAEPGDEVAVLGALLGGVAIGELLGIHDWLEALGAWFQRRLGRGVGEADTESAGHSRVAEAFVTASLVFCVGPLTILGSLENGLRGDVTLLSIKSLLDGIAAVAFAAALGAGVYLAAITVLVVQGSIAAGAFMLRDVLDARAVLAITSVGGMMLLGIGLRLLDLKQVRVANFLPGLVLAPIFVGLAEIIRGWLAG